MAKNRSTKPKKTKKLTISCFQWCAKVSKRVQKNAKISKVDVSTKKNQQRKMKPGLSNREGKSLAASFLLCSSANLAASTTAFWSRTAVLCEMTPLAQTSGKTKFNHNLFRINMSLLIRHLMQRCTLKVGKSELMACDRSNRRATHPSSSISTSALWGYNIKNINKVIISKAQNKSKLSKPQGSCQSPILI